MIITFHFASAVEKKKFYPSTPLTRYKEAAFPIVKKKVVEHLILDDEVHRQLDILATSKLCIRLNTYRVSVPLFVCKHFTSKYT